MQAVNTHSQLTAARQDDLGLVRATGRIYAFQKTSRAEPDGLEVVLPAGQPKSVDGRWHLKFKAADGTPGAPGIDGEDGDPGPMGPAGSGEVFTAENKDVVPILKGQPVAVDPSGVGVVLANGTVYGKECVGLATEDIAVGFTGVILVDGPLELADWTDVTGSADLVPLGVYFLDTVSGKLTTTPPETVGYVLQRCGVQLTPAILQIKVDYPINL